MILRMILLMTLLMILHWRRRRSVAQDQLGPPVEDTGRDVESPVDGPTKGHFDAVNFTDLEAGDLAPGTRRVVAVLQVLRRQDQRGQEHPASTLEGADRLPIVRLLPAAEVGFRNAGHDDNQVVECYLQGGVAGA